MKFLKDLFSKKILIGETGDRPFAYPLNYNGAGPYQKSFTGTGFGVVFEDDGSTGYLYATNENHSEIFDALHLYNDDSKDRINEGEEIFIVWNQKLQKAGIYFHNEFHAIIDFKNQKACCKNGSPNTKKKWCKSNHKWDDGMTEGLE